jgi:MFS family permease
MTSYRDAVASGEFRALFVGRAAGAAAATMQQLAISVLIYARTGSPLLAVLAFAAGSLPQLLGAMTLMAAADRLPPRRLLAGWQLLRALAVALLATGVLPVWGALVLLLAAGACDGVAAGAGYALLADVLPGQYVLGRSILNMADGAMQIAGYGTGGVLIAALGPYQALWAATALTALAAAFYRCGLRRRASRIADRGHASFRQTWHNNKMLLSGPRTRILLLAQWLPNGLIVGAEALYVPYAGRNAGILFTAAAAGMLAGDTIIGRWTTARQRARLTSPLYALLAAPYLAFLARPGPIEAAALVAAASFGYAACLGVQERFLQVVPGRISGHALGFAGAGMMTAQAMAIACAGALADVLPAGTVMALAGATSLLTTGFLLPRLRSGKRPAKPGKRPRLWRPAGHRAEEAAGVVPRCRAAPPRTGPGRGGDAAVRRVAHPPDYGNQIRQIRSAVVPDRTSPTRTRLARPCAS